jgi:hypothetical protein
MRTIYYCGSSDCYGWFNWNYIHHYLLGATMKSGFRYFCFICASLLATQVFAADMSGWSDKTVCRLAKATPDNTEFQTELTKRSLICGGQASSSSVKSNNKLLPNGLKHIKVIKDWEPVADFEALKAYSKLVPISGFRVRKNKEWNCIDRITNVNPYPDNKSHRAWTHCQAYVHGLAASNPQILGNVLLSWASAKKDPMVVIPNPKSGEYNVAGYDIPSTIGTFSQSYALWYDEIAYTPDERKRVDDYMTKKLMQQKFPVLNPGRRQCNINNINSVYHKKTGSNNCGNIRMKVSVGEIMLGFRLENQTLLDKGHDDIYVVQAFINKDGININHASRGGNTVNYSWEYTYYSSLLAEIYTTVGYDYFEHTLPHGAKVHEYLSFNYRLLKDFKLTAQWAKNNVGSKSDPYRKIKNLSQAEYQKTDNARDAYSWWDGDKEFVKAHTKFVNRYMPELYTFDVKSFMRSNFNESANFGVHPYMLHLGNNLEKIISARVNTKAVLATWLKSIKWQGSVEDAISLEGSLGYAAMIDGEYALTYFWIRAVNGRVYKRPIDKLTVLNGNITHTAIPSALNPEPDAMKFEVEEGIITAIGTLQYNLDEPLEEITFRGVIGTGLLIGTLSQGDIVVLKLTKW